MNARPRMDSVDLYNDVARDEKIWKVRMPNGATKAMTVAELDAAFDRADIGLTTLVQRPSGGEWLTLGEAAGVDDSIRPVSSDFELIEIPKPPPLPRRIVEAAESARELSVRDFSDQDSGAFPIVIPTRKNGRRLAAVAMIGLLIGGVAAWRYMPAKPIGTIASTTILAPQQPHVVQAAAQLPAPATPVQVEPAPEGNALAEQTVYGTANLTKAAKPVTSKTTAKPAKAQPQKTTWKQRMKLHAKTKKHV